MRSHQGWFAVACLLAGALLGTPGQARAELITSGPGLEGLGSFTGTLEYVAASGSEATLTISLTNTSPEANGGYLTAFALNNPGGAITGATLASTNANFALLGAPSFNNGVSGAPFGLFDLGASTGGSFQGGGQPSSGIGVGQSATFTFTLAGADLDTLSAASFVEALSAPGRDGQGPAWFVARFRGFADGGSDKVPGVAGDPPPILSEIPAPEPGTAALGGIAGLLFAASRLVRRGKRTRPAEAAA